VRGAVGPEKVRGWVTPVTPGPRGSHIVRQRSLPSSLHSKSGRMYAPRSWRFDQMTTAGHPIELKDGKLHVPHDPILPFIEGDGTGPDIWRASVRVFDAAVAHAYKGHRRI